MDSLLVDYIPRWDIALDGLTLSEIDLIESCVSVLEFPPRSELCVEGQFNSAIFVVTRGRVRTFYVDVTGRVHSTRFAGPGALLGIISVMTDTPSAMSLGAVDTVVVKSIPKSCFLELVQKTPRLSLNLNRLLAGMYREHMLRSKRATNSAPVRLGKILCTLASLDQVSDVEGRAVLKGITHEYLATLVGSTRAWVTQMLAAFEQRKLVVRGRGYIEISSLSALASFVSEMEASEG